MPEYRDGNAGGVAYSDPPFVPRSLALHTQKGASMARIRSMPHGGSQHGREVKERTGGVCGPGISILLRAIALPLAALLAVSPASADDMMMASGVLEAMGWAFIIWIGATLFIEAWILNAFLKLGYRRALAYSVLANLASALLSLLWAGLFQESGWKIALLSHEWGILLRLLVRSYVVTMAEEGMVVALLMRNRRSIGTVFTAVALANLASYALIAVMYPLTVTHGFQ